MTFIRLLKAKNHSLFFLKQIGREVISSHAAPRCPLLEHVVNLSLSVVCTKSL